MREFLTVVAINLVLALLLAGLAYLVWSKSPLTAGKLRRLAGRGAVRADGALPCAGRLLAAAELERVLDETDSAEPMLTALLLRWSQCGAVALADRPKKEMKSFGEDVQPQMDFLEDAEPPQMETAEALLWQTLRAWAGEDASLQQNELYSRARDGHAELLGRIDHLKGAGRHALREMGVSHWEEKPGKLIFAAEKREVYSQKGVRTARGLLAYRKFCDGSSGLRGEQALFAVLAGSDHLADRAALARARALAEACLNGAAAGERAGKLRGKGDAI